MDRARAFEPIQDGRIYIEKINRPMIDEDRGRRLNIGPDYSM